RVIPRKLIAGAVVTTLLLGGVAVAAAIFRPDRAIRVGTGFVAHNLCVKSFVSGLDPQTAFAEIKDRAGIRRMRYLLGYHLDATAGII
ncbi:MAG TPA: serine hydrolase, partial [Bradyrhizobium sp.]|nr:serine hydrolase [Bradyrhizobium sp.]